MQIAEDDVQELGGVKVEPTDADRGHKGRDQWPLERGGRSCRRVGEGGGWDDAQKAGIPLTKSQRARCRSIQ